MGCIRLTGVSQIAVLSQEVEFVPESKELILCAVPFNCGMKFGGLQARTKSRAEERSVEKLWVYIDDLNRLDTMRRHEKYSSCFATARSALCALCDDRAEFQTIYRDSSVLKGLSPAMCTVDAQVDALEIRGPLYIKIPNSHRRRPFDQRFVAI